MSLLDENLRALSARHPALAKALRALEEVLRAGASRDSGLRILQTPSGHPTAVRDGVYLHGRHDPRRDAAAQVGREIDRACTSIIVMGFGLGYGAEAARLQFPSQPLLVVEPDAGVFLAALSSRDLRTLLEDPGVRLHVNAEPDALPAVLESLPLAVPGFLRLRPAIQGNPARYRASEETIQSWLLRRDINVNTLARFGRLWVRNLCRNMRAFLECPGIASLHGLFDGIPALVVAGGPSLDALAPHLRALRDRMLLVAVNTPLRACLTQGVEPDFTAVVDPQYWASRSLDWTLVRAGVLVAEPSTCPRVLRRPAERFFLCSSLFPLGETLEAAVGEKGKLGAGGSVSTSAWDLARLLGARPLYAAGLDLGFPGMRTHCRGSYAESMWFAGTDRFSPVEGSSFRSLRDIGLFPVRASGGGMTPTDRRMLLYKWWFENQLRIHPDLPSFTLCADSVAIQGMGLARVEEALALPVLRPEIDRRMERVRQIHDSGPGDSGEALRATVGELSAQLAELESLAQRGRALSAQLAGLVSAHANPAACLREMDEIDQGILAVSARNLAGFLIQSVIHGITGQGEKASEPDEVVARSQAMYAGIADSAAWQNGLLRHAMDALGGSTAR